MEYLDANVFIFAILDKGPRGDAARRLLGEVVVGDRAACSASLTWDEVVWKVRRLRDAASALAAGRELLAMPGIAIRPVRKVDVAVAQDLVDTHRLKPRDALHAAVARASDAQTIVSDDDDFARLGRPRWHPLVPTTG